MAGLDRFAWGRCRSRYQMPPVANTETRASMAAIEMTAASWRPPGAVAVGQVVGWLPIVEVLQSYCWPCPELHTDARSWLAGSCFGAAAFPRRVGRPIPEGCNGVVAG
jgi:hypothetical protein